jgi:hypothetical protein
VVRKKEETLVYSQSLVLTGPYHSVQRSINYKNSSKPQLIRRIEEEHDGEKKDQLALA